MPKYTATLTAAFRAYSIYQFEASSDGAAYDHLQTLDADRFTFELTRPAERIGDEYVTFKGKERDEDGYRETCEICLVEEGDPTMERTAWFVRELAKRPLPIDNPELALVIQRARRECTRVQDDLGAPPETDTKPDGDDAMRNRIDRELTEGE